MTRSHHMAGPLPRLSRLPCASALTRWLAVPLAVYRETAAATTAQSANAQAVTFGGIGQVVIGLAAVLALILAIAWLLKRFPGVGGARSGPMRIVGGAALGQRERIVVVEVGETWLLIGVAPGQVRTLHTMPRNESAAPPDMAPPANPGNPGNPGLAGWLQRVMERRSHE